MISLRPRGARSCGSCSSVYLSAPRRVRSSDSHRLNPKHTRRLTSKARPTASEQCRPSVSLADIFSGVSRPRTSWGHTPQYASFCSWRAQSSWHRPGCKWVRSEGDPRKTPRDNDCPACQEEASRPTELSHRELIWQRQIQFMRDFLERDPYDALFGRSNDRLRGILPRSFWHEALRRPWSMKAWELLHPPTLESAGRKINESPIWTPRPREKDGSAGVKSTTYNISTSAKAETNIPQGAVHGYGRWKVTTTTSSGETSVESGEMIYDPITMRMIPSEAKKPEPVISKSLPEEETSIPIKTERDANKEQAQEGRKVPPQASIPFINEKSDAENASVNLQPKIKEEALKVPPKAKTGDSEVKPTTSNQEKATSKDQQPSITQDELAVTNLHLNSSATPRISNSTYLSRGTTVGNALSSLRKTDMALQTLQDSGSIKNVKSGKDEAKIQTPEKSNVEEDKVPRKREPKISLPIKEALEKSWSRENGFADRNDTSKTDRATTSKYNDGHFRQSPHRRDQASRQAYETLVKRDRALKHLNSFELGNHRAALLRSWAKKHESSNKTPTPAEKRLDEEIKAQKLAMTAFEDKWRLRKSESSNLESQREGDAKPPAEAQSSASITGEGDVCPDVATFAKTDRLYKRKAPHSLIQEEQKLQDRALVSEIRTIYETFYGLIDENHRQRKTIDEEEKQNTDKGTDPGEMTPTPASNTSTGSRPITSTEKQSQPQQQNQKPKPSIDRAMYQILAYDPSTQSIHTAKASSSFCPPTGDRILSVPDALPRLHHPAKFLPYLSEHHIDGYEIVSANKNLLVFKRIRPSGTQIATSELSTKNFHQSNVTVNSKSPSAQHSVNPVDGTAFSAPPSPPKTSTGNFASPTGFVNHDVYDEPPRPSSTPSPGNPRIRKEEAVFTGRPRKWSSRNNPAASSAGDGGKPNPLNKSKGANNGSGSNSWAETWSLTKRVVWYATNAAVLVYAIYVVGWWMEQSKEPVARPGGPLLLTTPAVDENESDITDNFRPGFWAAVNREQTRRADAADAKAVIQRMEDEKTQQIKRREEGNRKLVAIAHAGVDVAVFGALLWAFMKFIEASGK